jgi:hypothetical protein
MTLQVTHTADDLHGRHTAHALTHSITKRESCSARSKQHLVRAPLPGQGAVCRLLMYNAMCPQLRLVSTLRTSMSGLSGSRRGICLSFATMMVTTRSSSFVVFTTSTANRPAL